jgi:hypothetical protein
MTDRELMQQALDALEKHVLEYETAELLRARLARIRCIVKDCQNHRHEGKFVGDLCSPCHTFITTGEGEHSQAYRNSQREWQGLTDEEVKQLWKDTPQLVGVYSYTDIAREVEAKLKEKNT